MRKELSLSTICVFCLALAGCAAGLRPEGGNRPRPLYKPAPVYPAKAYKEKLSGDVRLTVLVNEMGQMEKVEVISERSLGRGLAAADAAAVEKWIWEPARSRGRNIWKWVNVEVRLSPGRGNPGPVVPFSFTARRPDIPWATRASGTRLSFFALRWIRVETPGG
jgi:TonB family protein